MTRDKTPPPWYSSRTPSEDVQKGRRRHFTVPILMGVLLIATLFIAAFAAPREEPQQLESGGVLLPASLSDVVAGCTGLVLRLIEENTGPLPPNSIHAYSRVPPTSGTWSLPAAQPGVYGTESQGIPRASQVVAALHEGRVAVWYNPDITPERFSVLASIARSPLFADTVTVLPWPTDGLADWSKNRDITLTSWGVSQGCDVASSDVFSAFVENALMNPLAHDLRERVGYTPESAGSQ